MILITSNIKRAQAKGPPKDLPEVSGEGPKPDDVWVWKPDVEYTFLPEAPGPESEITPEPPSALLGEDVSPPLTPIEQINEQMDTREIIVQSLYMTVPLRISYTTLDGTYQSDRTIHPDYVYYAGTNRHILVAWDELRDDWRAFSVDNINKAMLLEVQ